MPFLDTAVLNIDHLTRTIQRNCHISDAHYAGHYTMCIFLLKMREYYRWEQGIPLTARLPTHDVGDWLAMRENLWARYEDKPFEDLPLSNSCAEPFDVPAVNHLLVPQGLVYSAGFGVFNKPHFLLARLVRHQQQDDIDIYVTAQELARDLVAPPAMTQQSTIYIRTEALRRHIWEKIEEWRLKSDPSSALGRFIDLHRPNDDMELTLDSMTAAETESLILHELGEVAAGQALGPDWEDMLAQLPRSRAEFLARAVRDLLADCQSTLPKLLESDIRASVHFFFSNFQGLRRQLFPELHEAYERWASSGQSTALQRVIHSGRDRWQRTAADLLDIYRSEPHNLRASIEHYFSDHAH